VPFTPVSPNSSSRAAQKSRDTISHPGHRMPSSPLLLRSRFLLDGNSPVGNEKKSSRLNKINGFTVMPIEVIRRKGGERG